MSRSAHASRGRAAVVAGLFALVLPLAGCGTRASEDAPCST